jgi:hypothetical protein
MVLCCKVPGIILCHNTFFAGSITMRSLTSDHLGPYLDNHVASGQSSCVQEDRRTEASDASGPEDAELPGSADSCHGPTARSTPTPAFEACTLYTAIQGRTDVSACHHDFISNSVPSPQNRTHDINNVLASTVGTELNWRTSQAGQSVLLEVQLLSQLFESGPGNQQRSRSLYN